MDNIKDNLIFVENKLTLDDFIRLKEQAFGDTVHRETAKRSLNGSLYIIHVELAGYVIGMARIIGDGGYVNYLADMIVVPEYQAMGIGRMIMDRVISYVKNNIPKGGDTMIELAAALGKEGFYEKFGYKSRPNEKQGHSMQLYLKG